MFENMSQRERRLAIAVACLLPVLIAMFGIVWFIKSLNGYDTQIVALQHQIDDANVLKVKQAKTNRRLDRYMAQSLSSNPQAASADYREWLARTLTDIFGEYQTDPKPESAQVSKNANSAHSINRSSHVKPVYTQYAFHITIDSTDLATVDKFLFAFYQAPVLHRIARIDLLPWFGRPGDVNANVPTGKVKLIMDIEALGLGDAPVDKSIDERAFVQSAHDLDWYRQKIEHRNIFGFPNNPPSITTANESEYEDRDIAFSVSAKDDDARDQLRFELVSSDVPSATLTQRDASSKSAQLQVGKLPVGTYKFLVRVTDDGLPQKSAEKEISLVVKKKAEPPPVAEKAPPFKHATETLISGFVRGKDGVDRAWIYVRTLGEMFEVGVGDSFKVDDLNWTVVRIDMHQKTISLEVDGQLKTYGDGDRLSDPQSTSAISTTHAPDETRAVTDENDG